jgi:hypothetical protein
VSDPSGGEVSAPSPVSSPAIIAGNRRSQFMAQACRRAGPRPAAICVANAVRVPNRQGGDDGRGWPAEKPKRLHPPPNVPSASDLPWPQRANQ